MTRNIRSPEDRTTAFKARGASMFRMKESIHIDAPVDRCFLLSTSVPLVGQILGLHVAEGKSNGLIADKDRILWRGWKFGLPQLHETLITGYSRPEFFQDTMGKGRFRHFQHDHNFRAVGGQTLCFDVVRFSLPFGPIGHMVGRRIMIPHIMALMRRRFALLKRVAESEEWRSYLPEGNESAAQTSVLSSLAG